MVDLGSRAKTAKTISANHFTLDILDQAELLEFLDQSLVPVCFVIILRPPYAINIRTFILYISSNKVPMTSVDCVRSIIGQPLPYLPIVLKTNGYRMQTGE